MRMTSFALLTLCAVVGHGRAQPPGARPAAPPDASRNTLDRHLLGWEEAMKKVESLALACTRTEIDPVYKTRKSFEGTIHFVKPTRFYWNMKPKDKPQEFERFICTGTYIYQFVPASKEVRVYPAPKPKPGGGLADDSSVAFLFGMKAAEAKGRYQLSLFKEDQNYVYVDITPLKDVDKADFQKARIVLNRETYLPRQLWFQHPNAGEVVWDIPTIQTNPKIDQRVFGTPATPAGWKMIQGQSPAKRAGTTQPRVYRPQH